MLILGIESTCDETGIALVKDGRTILRNEISSSVPLHKKYGGVIPEIAAREQIKIIIPLVEQVVSKDIITKIDAIAVSYGPGLIGSLLVGVETAKALAVAWDKKLIAVNHLVGHVYSNWLQLESNSKLETRNSKPPVFPLVALVVSGGHTDLLFFDDHKNYQHLGGTNDDAAGEAFDKIARFLGLSYPGGSEIERLAAGYKVSELSFKFPRPMINSQDFNFSFSGLKTAVANLVHSSQFTVHSREEIAFAFQEAICDVLVSKTVKAAKKYKAKSIVVGGGVAANSRLRSQLMVHSLPAGKAGSSTGIETFFPPKYLSVDNGAMIAAAAFFNQNFVDPVTLSADSSIYF